MGSSDERRSEAVECTGDVGCTASPHWHGCHADYGDCEAPHEHPARSNRYIPGDCDACDGWHPDDECPS